MMVFLSLVTTLMDASVLGLISTQMAAHMVLQLIPRERDMLGTLATLKLQVELL